MNRFVFDGKNCADFGIYISGVNTFNSPTEDIERVSIPGRNGDLIISHGRYNNITLSYPAFVLRDFRQNVANARAWLLSRRGYCKLKDDYHLGEYRMARFSGPLDFATRFLNLSGTTEIYFDCKPQRFLESGDTVITLESDGTIVNPTMFEAKPLLDVYCAGSGSITINDTTIHIADIGSMITIDCETQNAYHIAQNLNNKIMGDFFVLQQGENSVSFDGDITRIDMRARWYTL